MSTTGMETMEQGQETGTDTVMDAQGLSAAVAVTADEDSGAEHEHRLVEHLDAQPVPCRKARRASQVLRETSAALSDLNQEHARSAAFLAGLEALIQNRSLDSRQQNSCSPVPEGSPKPEASRRSVILHPRPPKLEKAPSIRQSAFCASPNVISFEGLQATPASSPGKSARFGSKRASFTAGDDVSSSLEGCEGPTTPQRSAASFTVPRRCSLSSQGQLDSLSRRSLRASASNVPTPAPPAGSAAVAARLMRCSSIAMPGVATDPGPGDQMGSGGSSTAEALSALPDGLLPGASLGKPLSRPSVVFAEMAEFWMPDTNSLARSEFTDNEDEEFANGAPAEESDSGAGFVTLTVKKAAKQLGGFMNRLLSSPAKQRRPEKPSNQGTGPERSPGFGIPRPPSRTGPHALGPPPVLRAKSHRATWDCGFEAPLGDNTMSGALTSMDLGMPMPCAGKADGVPARNHIMSLSAHNLGGALPKGRTPSNSMRHAVGEPRISTPQLTRVASTVVRHHAGHCRRRSSQGSP